jgi:hypothetical protein
VTSFYDLFNAPETTRTTHDNVTQLDPARATRYATKALTSECENVAGAAEGTRNHTLNRAAFSLGQLVAAGHLTHDDTWRALTDAGRAAGLDPHEIEATLRSGLGAGQHHPRAVPDQPQADLPAVTVLVIDDNAGTPTDDPGDPGVDTVEVEVATWAPQPLDDVLDGTYTPELPALMPRTDNQHLLYPGRVHSFHGESESGKSLIAQAEAARLLRDTDQRVLFIDFESDKAAVTGRMIELGATRDQLRARFTYVRPEVDPRRFPHEREAVTTLLADPYALAVIDGVTEALGVFGASTKDNDDITTWIRLLPRTVARLTGAAVVLVDHVTKNSEDRGRFAIGGQAKMAALDGAAYVVEVTEALGRGKRGLVTLRVAKDRPGGVRAHAGPFRPTDRTQEAARIIVDSTPDTITPDQQIVVTVLEPRDTDNVDEFRPTAVMEKVSRFVEQATQTGDGVTGKVLEDGVDGRADTIRKAVAILVRDHYIRVDNGPRNSRIHTSLQPYREVTDRASDKYVTTLPGRPRPTSSDLVPDEVTVTSSQPPRSGAGRDEVSTPRTGSPRPDEQDEDQTVAHATNQAPADDALLVACTTCFRPTPDTVASRNNGRCPTCVRNHGEDPQ